MGKKQPGHKVIDPAWERQVALSTGSGARAQREDMREVLRKRVLKAKGGRELFEELEALNDPGAFD